MDEGTKGVEGNNRLIADSNRRSGEWRKYSENRKTSVGEGLSIDSVDTVVGGY